MNSLQTPAVALALALAATSAAAQIVLDGRTVETKEDGICIGLLSLADQRYIDCLNGTVYDTVTGLVWLQFGWCQALGSQGTANWSDAMDAAASVAHGLDCDGNGVADLSDRSQPGDWRLATDAEWNLATRHALAQGCVTGDMGGPTLNNDPGDQCQNLGPSAFNGALNVSYWTSQAFEPVPSRALARSLETGQSVDILKSAGVGSVYIWPVRETRAYDGNLAALVEDAPVETAAAGPCYGSVGLGQERYVDCGDGTVLDLRTDLLWLRDATCTALGGGAGDYLDITDAVAELGDGSCGLTDGSQPGDWRLPTPFEWTVTADRAAELGCTLPGDGDPPALTDTAGTGCLADGTTPFVGLGDTTSFEFWTRQGVEAHPDSFLVYPLRYASHVSVRSKLNTETWVWPVRPRRAP